MCTPKIGTITAENFENQSYDSKKFCVAMKSPNDDFSLEYISNIPVKILRML